MRLFLAIRTFFAVLLKAETAEQVRRLLSGIPQPSAPEAPAPPPEKKVPPPPARSDAISLLAALQREARFLDFVKEPLEGFSDAQIGAVARDVHSGCRAVLDRLLAIESLVDTDEGAEIEVPAGFDAGCYQLTGNVSGSPPFRGSLVHHGWKAGKCELPNWSGSRQAAMVIAPTEVELK